MKIGRITAAYNIYFILHLGYLSFVSSQFSQQQQLFYDSPCRTENEIYGICKKIQECPPVLAEALEGKRSATSLRCGFDKYTEIVCCPLSVNEKLGIRPADSACQQYENEIFNVFKSEELNFHVLSGIRATPGEFPYMASLGYMIKDDMDKYRIRYDCGGTLISSRFVLTAAHCVNNINEQVPVVVRLGSIRIDEKSNNVQKRRITNIISHPKYKRSEIYNDIALLKLHKPVKWTLTVQPICLQTRNLDVNDINTNSSFIVMGWGITDVDEDPSKYLLKSPGLTLMPHEKCTQFYAGFRQLPRGLNDEVICAIDSNTTRRADTCEGDSGGPLIMRTLTEDIIIGVTSFGQSCGGPAPGVYTSVYAYLDWIEANVWDVSKNN